MPTNIGKNTFKNAPPTFNCELKCCACFTKVCITHSLVLIFIDDIDTAVGMTRIKKFSHRFWFQLNLAFYDIFDNRTKTQVIAKYNQEACALITFGLTV